MYGLKEAGVFAFNQLIQKLAPAGYKPTPFTPGLWRHHTKRTTFALCVNEFGMKYPLLLPDAMHLINAVKAPLQPTPSPEPPCSWTTSTLIHTVSSDTTQAI
jgi:hypothetical protein